MTKSATYLITGAGGGVAGISPQVVTQLLDRGETVRAMVHHDDSRADARANRNEDEVLRRCGNSASLADCTKIHIVLDGGWEPGLTL